MTKYGFTLYCEGFSPKEIVRRAVLAEEAGFDFLAISDHYHPWLANQEHAGFTWSILGAIAQATSRIELATMVTCPIVRYHPVIVAQMAATVGVLSEGRFTLGVGTGERLNEHVIGRGWPPIAHRQEMMREAVGIIRALWEGDYTSYVGNYFEVEDARVFDLPAAPMEVFMAAGGPGSARVAAEVADGLCVTEPKGNILNAYKNAGGNANNIWGQIVLSWDEDEQRGLQTAHEQFRFSAGGWKVQAELPNPVNFDAATKYVTPSDLAPSIPSGPDAQRHLEGVQQFIDAGVNHLSVAYPGQDVEGFLRFWQEKIRPQL